MPSTISTDVNSSLLQWPDENRQNVISRENAYLINIWKWNLHLLHLCGGVDGAPLGAEITHIVRLTCWNPHPPLENHRPVSSRCHSQKFSTFSLFCLELFARMLPLRTSMCFTWLPAEGTQGPWRFKMKSSHSESMLNWCIPAWSQMLSLDPDRKVPIEIGLCGAPGT